MVSMATPYMILDNGGGGGGGVRPTRVLLIPEQ